MAGQNDILYGIDGSYVLLQGLCFFRILELEIDSEAFLRRVYQVLFVQTGVIICFSMLQLFAKIPVMAKKGGMVCSPFDDVHSYASYVVFLFFVMVSLSLGNGKKTSVAVAVGIVLLALLFLSTSFAALGATVIVGCVYAATQFRFGKLAVVGFCILVFGILTYIHMHPTLLDDSEGTLAKRYAKGLTVDRLVKKLGGRFSSADQAFGIIHEYPITGRGVGTFYRVSRNYHFSDTPHPRRIENAHNYYLQFCADLGIPALLIFLGIFWYTFKDGLGVLRAGGDEAGLVRGLLFGLSAYLLTMLTGHPLLLSNQSFLFWFVIGVINIAAIAKERKGRQIAGVT